MTRKIHTPGAAADELHADQLGQDAAPQTIEELQALLAQRDGEIAALQASKSAAAKANLPVGVYEPVTPKGKQALAASAFAHLTVDQLIEKIDAGEVQEPRVTSFLCADGYYCRRT